jgi:hypothetical protein
MRLFLILALLGLHAGLLLDGARQNFVCIDEVGHIPAGLAHWRSGTFRYYRVNPPLPRMLAALPLLAAGLQMPDSEPLDAPGERPEWEAGRAFSVANGPRYLDLVRLARLPGILWSVLGGCLVYRWSQELYGGWAGLLALALWCFEPTAMAFGQVVVPDGPAAVAGLAAAYCFWRYLRRPAWGRACWAGVFLGVAQLTKGTFLILYAVWPALWILDSCLRRRLEPPEPVARGRRWAQGSAILLLSVLVLNLGYGFRGTCRPLGEFAFVSRALAGPPPDGAGTYEYGSSDNRFRESWLAGVPVPVPTDFVLGIDLQRRDFEAGFRSYLGGEIRHRGWWYYYLYALAVKVPVGTAVLVLWGLFGAFRGLGGARLVDEAALWLPAFILLAFVSSQTGFNHHLRYVLPAFPLAFVSAGKLAGYWARRRWRLGLVVGLLLGWGIIASIRIHPHSMSYFNEIAGGPDNGHNHLLDSNIDWGQDLLFLKRWLDRHPEARPLGLAYYHYVDPRLVGIDFTLPPPGPTDLFPDDPAYRWSLGPHPGYFAVSVNLVRGLNCFTPDGRGGLRPVRAGAYEYFQHFQPIGKAGYSLFLYRITPEEANAVRRQLGLPPLSPPILPRRTP